MVWACDAKGGDGHNKKHVKYESDETTRPWYGHVMRREKTGITRSTLSMKGTRPRGRPKMRWLDRLKIDMRIHGINPDMATHKDRWYDMVKNVDTTKTVEDGNNAINEHPLTSMLLTSSKSDLLPTNITGLTTSDRCTRRISGSQ